jgi:hypothetical protein
MQGLKNCRIALQKIDPSTSSSSFLSNSVLFEFDFMTGRFFTTSLSRLPSLSLCSFTSLHSLSLHSRLSLLFYISPLAPSLCSFTYLPSLPLSALLHISPCSLSLLFYISALSSSLYPFSPPHISFSPLSLPLSPSQLFYSSPLSPSLSLNLPLHFLPSL